MSIVVDVDSHAEPAPGWLDEFPRLKAALPPRLPQHDPQFTTGEASPEMFAWFVASDLQRGRPVAERMPASALTTPVMRRIYESRPADFIYPGADQHWTLDSGKRLAWLDEQGIDVQMLISGAAYTLARAIDDPVLAMDALEAVNTWMVEHVGPHADRMKPVVTVRLEDLDRAVGELERMRGRGSRIFLIPGEPVDGIPHFDPHFDRLWAAACDLGMVAMLHVGMGPATMHPGWANTTSPALVKRMATSMSYQAAPILVNAMVFGGVFERFPNLTLVISEFGIDWVPFTVANMDGRAAPGAALLGDYDLSLSPSDFVRRNVRVSPLPSPAQLPLAVLERLPEVPVFSTDHPHIESNPQPTAHYADALAGLDPRTRAAFLGDGIAECFARTGDPLPHPSR
jgi:predicted TIM-barrel fold metal-dependent hydrolase